MVIYERNFFTDEYVMKEDYITRAEPNGYYFHLHLRLQSVIDLTRGTLNAYYSWRLDPVHAHPLCVSTLIAIRLPVKNLGTVCILSWRIILRMVDVSSYSLATMIFLFLNIGTYITIVWDNQ